MGSAITFMSPFNVSFQDDYTRYREAEDCLEQKKEAYGPTFKEGLSRFEEYLEHRQIKEARVRPR